MPYHSGGSRQVEGWYLASEVCLVDAQLLHQGHSPLNLNQATILFSRPSAPPVFTVLVLNRLSVRAGARLVIGVIHFVFLFQAV